MEYDKLTNPDHYRSHSVLVEPICFCESLGFYGGNALKYIFRAGTKPQQPEEVDLLKACWYMNSFFKAYSVLKNIEDGYLSLVETRLSMMRFSENKFIRHASQQSNALQFFNALFIDCIARLVLLGVSLDEIFENIKYNETAYKRLFKQGVPECL